MHKRSRKPWRLRRKLELTAAVFALSLLGNLGVSTFAVLVYFRPALREAQVCFDYQQELEQIRADLRSGGLAGASPEAGDDELAPSLSGAALQRLNQTLGNAALSALLGPAGDELSAAAGLAEGASTRPEGEPGARPLAQVDHSLTQAIMVLGSQRQAAISRSSETQAWVIWILIANTCVGAVLCFIGLESVRGWVVHPVRALRQATDRFRQGDFKARVEVSRRDELGELGAELNRMAERIAGLQEQLIDTERRTAAVDMVSHLEQHIRPPLSRMKESAARSLAADRPGGEIAACQQRILSTIERFETWLGDLTGLFSRPALRLEPTTVDEIFSRVLAAVRPTLEKRQVGVRVDRDPGVPQVKVDRLQIEQALIALLTNAAEASSPGQTIELRIGRSSYRANEWEMNVEDHGCGISEEHLSRIFLPFFTTKPDGNGIGLELVREVIRMHSGRIAVESNLGQGTCFRAVMPVCPDSAENSDPSQGLGATGA